MHSFEKFKNRILPQSEVKDVRLVQNACQLFEYAQEQSTSSNEIDTLREILSSLDHKTTSITLSEIPFLVEMIDYAKNKINGKFNDEELKVNITTRQHRGYLRDEITSMIAICEINLEFVKNEVAQTYKYFVQTSKSYVRDNREVEIYKIPIIRKSVGVVEVVAKDKNELMQILENEKFDGILPYEVNYTSHEYDFDSTNLVPINQLIGNSNISYIPIQFNLKLQEISIVNRFSGEVDYKFNNYEELCKKYTEFAESKVKEFIFNEIKNVKIISTRSLMNTLRFTQPNAKLESYELNLNLQKDDNKLSYILISNTEDNCVETIEIITKHLKNINKIIDIIPNFAIKFEDYTNPLRNEFMSVKIGVEF